MNKNEIIVPKGIRYISDWKEYSLENFQFPHILNKQLTGCGYTEYCIRSDLNVILLSPRKLLLQNKEDQHKGEVFYFKNELEKLVNYEKDLTLQVTKQPDNLRIPKLDILSEAERIAKQQEKSNNTKNYLIEKKKEVIDYWIQNHKSPIPGSKPCKILVTYDSFRHVREALGDCIHDCYVVVDEFQSVLGDSRFKSTTEIELLYQLKDLNKVCFVSATPMLDECLQMLDEFKDLPYFEFNWIKEEPNRVIKPVIDIKFGNKDRSIESDANRIVQTYLAGDFDRYVNPDGSCIISNEGVFYVNSVSSIARIIKKNSLTPLNTNVLCAKTEFNEAKILKAFGLTKKELKKLYGLNTCLGKIPKKGEPHKMFTFCTRTVYLGADFYSTCARTFIFSDANIECLSVDISMDLEQILGRQRLNENPWKNNAYMYIRNRIIFSSPESFEKYVIAKEEKTMSLLRSYETIKNTAEEEEKKEKDLMYLAETYESAAKVNNYKNDYIGINYHSGKIKTPVFNQLVKVSELRTFTIQQINYRDRFMVLANLDDVGVANANDEITNYLIEFNYRTEFSDKLKYICEEMIASESIKRKFLNVIPIQFKNCYETLGPIRCKALGYQKSKIENEYDRIIQSANTEDQVINLVSSTFIIGNKYTRDFIKNTLANIYRQFSRTEIAKASDIEKWFEVKPVKITNKDTGKRDHGFIIMGKK